MPILVMHERALDGTACMNRLDARTSQTMIARRIDIVVLIAHFSTFSGEMLTTTSIPRVDRHISPRLV